ncbi:MAG: choice-of-anchor D domain-containing protein [Cyclobacteriaceae bacterium]|nr:choice-of-anchor D domain-containing protein [Cyclobacteriaceae bacterium]
MRNIYILLMSLVAYGVSLAQPVVSVDVATVSDALANGQTSVTAITITNNSIDGSVLNWTIDLADYYSNGPDVSFTKVDFADWTLTSNQDRITDNIWITRGDQQSIFNAKSETSSSTPSPADTEWLLGSTSTVLGGTYTNFKTAHGGDPTSLIGSTISMHLITDDIYYDVDVTSWSGGGPGGGFAWTRRQMMPWLSASVLSGSLAQGASAVVSITLDASQLATGLHNGSILINSDDPVTPLVTVAATLDVLTPGVIDIVEAGLSANLVSGTTGTADLTINNTGAANLTWNNNDPISFTKVNYADWALEENQDRISDRVWITRQDRMGLFNIAQETFHTRGVSPVGTRWAVGSTASQPVTYGDFRTITRPYHPAMAGNTFSLHLTEEDLYYDITFSSWTRFGAGGGFSYVRTTPLPHWLTAASNGIVASGGSSVITHTFDATTLYAGTYTYDLEIRSNDPTQPLKTIPVTLTVTGTPTISAVTTYTYADTYLGVANSYPLVISNTGTDVLNIAAIASDNAEFAPLVTALSIAPGGSATVPVVYTPATLGAVTGTLTITSDDPVTPSFAVSLSGAGLDLPDISFSSYSLSEVLAAGASNTQTLTIENTGATDLTWSLVTNITNALVDDGFRLKFTKENNANISLPINRDEIIPGGVELTRGTSGELYDFNGAALEWAMGTSSEVINAGGTYAAFTTAFNTTVADLVGRTISLHIIASDIYVDITIEAWQSGGNGGLVSYTRTGPMGSPNWLSAAATISGLTSGIITPGSTEDITVTFDGSLLDKAGINTGQIIFTTNVPSSPTVTVNASLEITNSLDGSVAVSSTTPSSSLLAGGLNTTTFTITNNGTGDLRWDLTDPKIPGTPDPVVVIKHNYANPTLAENQDRITDKVWITRGDNQGIFNIAQESQSGGNNSKSPIGTEWAYGYTDELSAGNYASWFQTNNQDPRTMIGKPVSLHLIEEDIYYDVVFLGWQGNSQGGGFSYSRSEPNLKRVNWLSTNAITAGTLAPGASANIILNWDATTNVYAGIHVAEMMLNTNDPNQPQTLITTSLEVFGNPEINIVETTLDFGDGYVGYATDQVLTIENIGTDVLNISNIVFDNTVFSVDATTHVVDPGTTLELPIHFTAIAQQAYTGTVTITTDDATQPSIDIPLSANGILPPNITVDVTSISEFLFTGETSTRTFTITNSGSSNLDWKLEPANKTIAFSKAGYADWNLPENQDRITENVWLTRGDQRPLFNIAVEPSSNGSNPADTEWALGSTASVGPGDYGTFRNLRNQIPNGFDGLPGQTVSLHLISEDLYYDITFSEWDANNTGGGFAYTRTFVGGSMSKSWVYIAKESGTLVAGASETVNVTFNPNANTTSGEYLNDIAFWSNDPDGVQPPMPLSLSIGGVITSAPTADILVQEGVGTHTVDISTVFTGAVGRTLTYSVTSNTGVATAAIAGTTLTIAEVATGTTNVVITADDGFGGTGDDTFSFRINATPVGSQMSDALYPFGFTSSIINLAGVFSDTDNDFLTLSATSSDPTIVDVAVVGNDLTITEVGSGDATITVTADDGFGGTVTGQFIVTVLCQDIATPVASIITEDAVTGEFTLSSTSTVSNQWYLDGVAITGAINQTYVTTVFGNYSVQVSNTAGNCFSAISTTVLVGCPVITTPVVTITNEDAVTGEFTLSSSSATGNQWFLDGTAIAGEINQTYITTVFGNYSVQVSSYAGGCTSALSTAVAVSCPAITTPVVTITAEDAITGEFTLSSSIATGNQWFLDGSAIAGATAQTYVTTVFGSYSVQVSSYAGRCTSALSTAVAVSCPVITTPVVTITAEDAITGEFTLSSSSATGNQWFLDGVAIAGATNQTYLTSVWGSYSVQVSSHAGKCESAMSDPLAVLITGSEADISNTEIKLWPNPAADKITFSLKGTSSNEFIMYRIIDLTGMVVEQDKVKLSGISHEMKINHLKQGMYMLVLQDGNKIINHKFIKE